MPERLSTLEVAPGIRSNGTLLQNTGRWVDGNGVRFHEGKRQPIGGWTQRAVTGAAIAGVPTKMVQWTPEIIGVTQRPILAIGTTAGLYVEVSGVVYDITPTGLAADAARVWSLDVFGSYLVATAYSHGDYTKHAGPFVWTGDTGTVAADVAAAPASVTSVIVTEERFLLLLAGVDELGPNFLNFPTVPSTRTVHWPSRETLTDWTPTPRNSAGNFPLVTAGDLRAGVRFNGRTMLLTTTDLHEMTYIGGEFIYRFTRKGTECGTIAVNAAVDTDVAMFWMGLNGFFAYDGYVKPVACDISDEIFSGLNRAYAHRIWSIHMPAFGEVWWFYPSGSSQVPDKYVAFSYREQHWSKGTLTRCAGVSSQPNVAAVPVLVGDSGVLWEHETGNVRTGMTTFLESGPVEIDGGNRVFSVLGMVPDESSLGQLNVTLRTRLRPTDSATTHGPFAHTALTSLRATARQVQLRFTEASASNWRLGTMRLSVVPGGMR